MPFAFLIIGGVMIVSGVRKTSGNLWTLVKGDFTGENNFVYWCLSILILGSLGYVPQLRPFSRMFLFLVIVVLLLSNNKRGKPGFFSQFNDAIQEITASKTQPFGGFGGGSSGGAGATFSY